MGCRWLGLIIAVHIFEVYTCMTMQSIKIIEASVYANDTNCQEVFH